MERSFVTQALKRRIAREIAAERVGTRAVGDEENYRHVEEDAGATGGMA